MDRTGRSSFSVLDNVMKERCNRVAQAWGIPLAYILFRDIFLCKSSISALIKIKLTYSLYSDWRNHSSLICYLKNHLSTDAMTTFCYINQARISEKCWPIWFCPGVRVHKGITIIPSLCRSHWLAVVYCLFLCNGSCEPVHEDRTKDLLQNERRRRKLLGGSGGIPPENVFNSNYLKWLFLVFWVSRTIYLPVPFSLDEVLFVNLQIK